MNQQLKFNPEGTTRLPNQPEARLLKQQADAGTLQVVLGRVLLNGSITTSWTQQHYVRWANACVLLVKNSKAEQSKPEPSAWLPLSVGSYLYSFIKHPFTCLLYQDILSPVCPRKASFDMTNFPKKLEVSTSALKYKFYSKFEDLQNWSKEMFLNYNTNFIVKFSICRHSQYICK